jgi:PAS domain S-box-containing protein
LQREASALPNSARDNLLFMADPVSGKLVSATVLAAERLARPLATILESSLEDLFGSDEAARIVAAETSLAGDLTLEGKRVRLESIYARGDANGAPKRFICVLLGARPNLSEHEDQDQDLTYEKRLRAIAAMSSDVIWDMELSSRTISWSQNFAEIFGRAPSTDLEKDAWLRSIHPDDQAAVSAGLKNLVYGDGTYWRGSYRLFDADGQARFVENRARLVLNDAGEKLRLVGTMTDLTGLKSYQVQVRERMKELRCLYRVLELTSDAALRIDAICAQIVEILPPSFLHEAVGAARLILEGRVFQSPDWTEPWAMLSTPITAKGRQIGSIDVAYLAPPEDLPPGHIFLEEEYAMMNAVAAHIANMVEERTLSQQVAQNERLRAIGELTGGVAHDFNNLLTVILGCAETLSESRELGAEGRMVTEMIVTAAERGANLTGQLLAFARRQPLAPEAIDVARLCAGMRNMLSRTLGEGIGIDLAASPDLWPALVDPSQLENAILNLCLNARDAMPAGGRVAIETSNVELDAGFAGWSEEMAPGAYVQIAVSDTGCGMDSDVAARVFEPFFTTKDVGKGSGLGLSMVFGFVRQSHGYVRLYSEPGKGTTIRLYLPRADGGAVVGGPAARAPRKLGSERLLLVEDDALVRQHVSAQLLTLGYDVVAAEDGVQALERLVAGERFDLLFTDVVMPNGLSGFDLAAKAREIDPAMRVLFTSGHTEGALGTRDGSGANLPLLQKPYRRDDLAARIRQALDEG